LISELQKGTQVDSGRITVTVFLDRWLEHMQGQVSPRSLERYTELAQKNLAPLLGALTLSKLQPVHISQAYAKALTSGRRDGSGGLSARTVTHSTACCEKRSSRLCAGSCSPAIPLTRFGHQR
jgi:hypothetical protein